jgi:RHS repeat-associated protein
MERYPNDASNHDFTHCRKTAWLWGPVDGYLWPIIDYVKNPLENRTEYSYVDEGTSTGGRGTIGTNTNNKPIKTSQVAATPIKAAIGGSKTTGDVLTLTFSDSALSGGSQAVAYTVQSADTLATITSALAAAVNANANLQKLGVTAAATGTNIVMVSQSANLTAYSKSLSGGATETISLATAFPQTAQVTMTGTATPGNYVIFGINVNGVSPGYLQYNVQSGDTLTSVATGLKNLINGSSLFTNQGVSANSFGPSIFLSTSSTPDSVSYGMLVSGAPTMSIDYQVSSGAITSVNQYNSLGHRTLSVNPNGLVISYTYAGNAIDLTQITEIQNNDSFMLGNWTYNGIHRPTQYINGSAQTWTYGYNSAGQMTSMTDPSSNTTTIAYTGTSNSFLTQINGPLSGNLDITTFSYDGFNRLDTTTDSEGYQLSFDYDSADRPILISYPDGTSEQTIYDKLDAIFAKDRLGRWSQSGFDSLDKRDFDIDPLGRRIEYKWCHCGSLSKLTDPAGNVTTWHHDLQGRQIEKVFANQTTVNYAYEPGAGRMLSRTDALKQTTNYFINPDGVPVGIGYQNTVNPTSAVIIVNDNKFLRVASVQNDWGTISYSYFAYVTSPGASPITGAGKLSTVHNNVIPSSDITYQYDALGNKTNRSIDGANNSMTWAYDAMARATSEQNALGTFNYTYVDDTPGSSKGVTRLASVAYPNSQITNYDWYGNTGDQLLKTINNLNPSSGTLSRFDYKYDPAGEILQWQRQQSGGNDFHNFKYDLAGQLVSDQVGSGAPHPPYSKEFHYAYDKAANRIGVQSHSVDTLRVSGTVTTSDVLTVTVKDSALSGGQQAISYTVQGGDTLSTIAQGIATAINTNTNLQAIGVAANAQSGKTFVNIRAASGNITTYSASTSGGATEVLSLGIWRNGLENAVIGGTKTTSDVLTLTFKDPALSGGTRNVAYTVQAGDTLTSIATNMAAAINADTPLQNLGVSATSVGTAISITSNSVNVTSYSSSLSGGATETITLSINQNALQTATIAGTKTTSDTITIHVYNSALGGGTQAVTYTVQSGDTLTSIATGLASAINGNGNLQAIAVSATSSGTVVTIQSKSTNLTTYRATTSSSATETVTLSVPVSAWTVAAIGGTKTTGNVLTITAYDAGLSGGKKAVNYTVQSGDTLTSIATNLAAALNADTDLQGIGVSATSNSTVVSLKSTSPNLTTFAQSVSAGATETIALSASTSVVQSTVNNVNELVALAPGGKARFQGSTSKPVVSASIAGQVVTISQAALKSVDFSSSVTGTPTETLTLSNNVTGNITATVGGTITPGDVLSVVINDIRFNNGPVTNSYKVKTGDTTSTIATGLSNAIYANLGTVGTSLYPNYVYYPNAAGSVVTINPYLSYADVTYSKSVTGVPTESLTSSANFNGNSTVTVGGTPTTGDVASLTVENVNLSGGEETVSYTVAGGNTTTDIATGLKNAINASSTLAAIGVTATSSAAIVTIVTAGTTYTTSTSGGATETLSLGTNANGNTTVAVGGKATNGDSVTVVTHNPLLPGGQESVSYTVGASDTLVEVAAGLAANMNGNSDLQGIDVTAKNSDTADLAFSQSFAGNGTLPVAASLANVRATDAVPTTKTNTNSLNVTASPSSTLTWDANGNMTSDGTNTYKWDAENRLIEIDYPGSGNKSVFSFDGHGRNRTITEYTSGSVTNEKQFVWNGTQRNEERSVVGGGATKRFFAAGQLNGSTALFYFMDQIRSVRNLTDSSGNLQAAYAYDVSGRVLKYSEIQAADCQFGGYFQHLRSGLSLTFKRLYSPDLGRWLSRDPAMVDCSYTYVENNSITFRDPTGMWKEPGSSYNGWRPGDPMHWDPVNGNNNEMANYMNAGLDANGIPPDHPLRKCLLNYMKHAASAAATTLNAGGGALGGAAGMGGGVAVEIWELIGNGTRVGVYTAALAYPGANRSNPRYIKDSEKLGSYENSMRQSLSEDTLNDLNADAAGAEAASNSGGGWETWGKIMDELFKKAKKFCCEEAKKGK